MYSGDLFLNCFVFQLVVWVCDINMKSCINSGLTVSLTVTRRVTLVKQEGLLTLTEHLRSPFRFQWGAFFCVLSTVLWCSLRFSNKNDMKRCSVCLYPQLFVGGLMSYLRYLCLFTYSGVQHILCCVSALFFFVLCIICCHFLCWLPLLYSLSFIYSSVSVKGKNGKYDFANTMKKS
jgi:hypothetical protein